MGRFFCRTKSFTLSRFEGEPLALPFPLSLRCRKCRLQRSLALSRRCPFPSELSLSRSTLHRQCLRSRTCRSSDSRVSISSLTVERSSRVRTRGLLCSSERGDCSCCRSSRSRLTISSLCLRCPPRSSDGVRDRSLTFTSSGLSSALSLRRSPDALSRCSSVRAFAFERGRERRGRCSALRVKRRRGDCRCSRCVRCRGGERGLFFTCSRSRSNERCPRARSRHFSPRRQRQPREGPRARLRERSARRERAPSFRDKNSPPPKRDCESAQRLDAGETVREFAGARAQSGQRPHSRAPASEAAQDTESHARDGRVFVRVCVRARLGERALTRSLRGRVYTRPLARSFERFHFCAQGRFSAHALGGGNFFPANALALSRVCYGT